MPKSVLIFGDSFSANWNVDFKYESWVDIISNEYNVTNVAQAGVGEYKILRQLETLDLSNFDFIIGNHTSHSRIHSRTSIHSTTLHSNCDLIYNDSLHLPEARWFFENIYDDDYFWYTYKIIREKISGLINSIPNYVFDPFYSNFKDSTTLKGKWKFSKNNKNHFSEKFNRILANKIIYCIND